MRSIWHSVAWKEWHEHKWKLAAITAVLCGVNLLCLPHLPAEVLTADYMITLLSIVPLAIFVAAGTATGERSRHTEAFLSATPVSLHNVGVAKLLSGLLTLVIAIALTFTLVYGWFWCWSLDYSSEAAARLLESSWKIFPPPVHFGNWFLSSAITISVVAASIFLWTAVAGTRAGDEIGAAARGMLAMVGWWILLLVLALPKIPNWFDATNPLLSSLVAASPGGAGMVVPRWGTLTAWAGTSLPLAVGLVAHLGVAVIFLIRFGQPASTWFASRPRSGTSQQSGWARRPWRSPFAAVAWKQFRESGPVVAVGLAGIIGITAITASSNWREVADPVKGAAEAYVFSSAMIGFLITLVVAIGISYSDLAPPLNHFWRSRPINPDLWFWTRFGSGLAILLVTLFVPALIALRLAGPHRDTGPDAVFGFLAINAAIYIAAVTITTLVRHAIYSAILSIAALYAGFGAALACVWGICWVVGWPTPYEIRNSREITCLMFAAILAVATGVMVLGWLAVRNDWGRKN